ncbi:hypothetical protein MNBD_GAMMA09-3555 [hydrothermal vent metagenome]|uniref:Lipoprotein n=1 Tax=hydrothermal vent metagenome TaxID=652676 RepID=A0A3B0XJH2_9ZZZZ
MRLNQMLIGSLAIILSACGGGGSGGGGGVPDPNAPTFKFFPPGYFVAGYREEFDFNGTRINAVTNDQLDVFTNNPVLVTQPEAVFNLTTVIPTLDVGEISFANGTATTPVSVTQYFTIDNNDRRYLGNVTIIFGFTTTTSAVSTSPIPETVRIGDSGIVGTYLDTVGKRHIISWDISDAGNDQARLTWTTTSGNATSSITDGEVKDISIIDVNGNRISKKIRGETFTSSPNIIDRWTGVKVP